MLGVLFTGEEQESGTERRREGRRVIDSGLSIHHRNLDVGAYRLPGVAVGAGPSLEGLAKQLAKQQ